MKKFGREKPKTITSMQQGVVVNAGVEKIVKARGAGAATRGLEFKVKSQPMDDIDLYSKLKRLIDNRRDQISETLMSGALESIEHYKFVQGELSALSYIEQEIREQNKDS